MGREKATGQGGIKNAAITLIFVVIAVLGSRAFASTSSDPVTDMRTELGGLEIQRQAAEGGKAQGAPVTVFIRGDEGTFSPIREGREIKFLEEIYHLPVISYAVASADEAIALFKMLTVHKILIKNLIVMGWHGDTVNAVPTFELDDRATDDFSSLDFLELQKAGVSLNFAADAYVYFDSCLLIKDETTKSIEISTGELKRIGFKTGWIYMNHDEGGDGVENTFTVPFYTERTLRGKVNKLAAQALWPLMLPFYAYMDRFKRNHGFLVGYSSDHEVIVRERSPVAESGEISEDVFYSR